MVLCKLKKGFYFDFHQWMKLSIIYLTTIRPYSKNRHYLLDFNKCGKINNINGSGVKKTHSSGMFKVVSRVTGEIGRALIVFSTWELKRRCPNIDLLLFLKFISFELKLKPPVLIVCYVTGN